jgi:hypothetical protein
LILMVCAKPGPPACSVGDEQLRELIRHRSAFFQPPDGE